MKLRACLALIAAVATLAGCNQYSTPAIQSNTAASRTAAPGQEGVNGRSVNPLNSQADPSQTTGSLGGSPAGTASAQTAPSSSNGVR